MSEPHLSLTAQQDITRALDWSFEHFGRAAEVRHANLIAVAIEHAAESRDSPGFKARRELDGEMVTWHLAQSVLRSTGDRVRNPRHFLLCRWSGDRLEVARLLHEVQDPALHFDPSVDWE